jgi:hypothetical protein
LIGAAAEAVAHHPEGVVDDRQPLAQGFEKLEADIVQAGGWIGADAKIVDRRAQRFELGGGGWEHHALT